MKYFDAIWDFVVSQIAFFLFGILTTVIVIIALHLTIGIDTPKAIMAGVIGFSLYVAISLKTLFASTR